MRVKVYLSIIAIFVVVVSIAKPIVVQSKDYVLPETQLGKSVHLIQNIRPLERIYVKNEKEKSTYNLLSEIFEEKRSNLKTPRISHIMFLLREEIDKGYISFYSTTDSTPIYEQIVLRGIAYCFYNKKLNSIYYEFEGYDKFTKLDDILKSRYGGYLKGSRVGGMIHHVWVNPEKNLMITLEFVKECTLDALSNSGIVKFEIFLDKPSKFL